MPAALLTLPAVFLLACSSAFSFRAWPFFAQKRIGLDGRLFWFVKIRSLPASAPTSADKYALETIENTRFGRFVRRSHLDELPQLWLVVSGRMSLVGPRPEMPALAATFDPDFVAARQRVRPGCTGLWQISPAKDGLIGEGSEYDLFYLDHASLRIDAWILYRTVIAMLHAGRGAPVEPPLWLLRGSVVIRSASGDGTSGTPASNAEAVVDVARHERHERRRSPGVIRAPSPSSPTGVMAGEPS